MKISKENIERFYRERINSPHDFYYEDEEIIDVDVQDTKVYILSGRLNPKWTLVGIAKYNPAFKITLWVWASSAIRDSIYYYENGASRKFTELSNQIVEQYETYDFIYDGIFVERCIVEHPFVIVQTVTAGEYYLLQDTGKTTKLNDICSEITVSPRNNRLKTLKQVIN